MKTLGETPKKLTDYTREDYNRILSKKQPNKKGDGLYNNALNSRKYNVADREREKEGLYKPQMADHSREVSPAIRSYMKKKGITDVSEAKRRYAKGEALVKKQQQKAKKVAPKKQNVDLGQKLESKGAGTLDSGIGSASIKRVTREAPAQKKTVKDVRREKRQEIKGIRAENRAERKQKRADVAAAKSAERNAAQTARVAGKAALKEAKTASKAQRITDKYNKKISKLKGANVAAKGGPVKKKQLPDGVKTLPNIVSKDSVGTKKIPKLENLPYKPQNDSIPKWEKLPYKPSSGNKKTKPLGSSKKFKCGGKLSKKC